MLQLVRTYGGRRVGLERPSDAQVAAARRFAERMTRREIGVSQSHVQRDADPFGSKPHEKPEVETLADPFGSDGAVSLDDATLALVEDEGDRV